MYTEMGEYSTFNSLAEALLLLYENRNSLFTEQVLQDKLHEGPGIIRSRIYDWAHTTPEELVMHLEPDYIKRIILKTKEDIKNKRTKRKRSSVHIIPMTMEEYNNGGESLSVHYQFADTPFGSVIIASTDKGICHLAFSDEENKAALNKLKIRFPKASYKEEEDIFQHNALLKFENKKYEETLVRLHLKGTPFQINTWKKLLEIPSGGLLSYSALADNIKDSHALGAAVGSNPIAYIIPCHRAVRASGEFGKYHWGQARKAALICLEAIQLGR